MKLFIVNLNRKIVLVIQLILIKIYLNDSCLKKDIRNNECLDECGTLYEFGDYCYEDCIQYNLVADASLKECKCKSETPKKIATIIEESVGQYLFYYRCTDSCPFKYYDIDTKICTKEDKCPADKKKIKKNYGCTDQCSENEVLFEETLDDGSKRYYCLDKCPEEKKFYIPSSTEEKECQENCPPEKKFYVIKDIGNECAESCENQAKIDKASNTFICTEVPKGRCTDEAFPYEFEGSCVKNCNDTQELEFFGKKETFLFYSEEYKKLICSETCEETYNNEENQLKTHKSYKVPGTQYCVDDCKNTNYKFFFDSYCLESCETDNLYPNNYNKYETGECVNSCNEEENYYLLRGEKTCYKKDAPPIDKKYLNSSQEWNTCQKPNDPERQKEGEGYFSKDDDPFCLSSCDSFKNFEGNNGKVYYIKYNDNECLTLNNEIKGKFYKYGDNNILYNSCKEIQTQTELYRYELTEGESPYKYECKETKGGNDLFYKVSEKIYYCLQISGEIDESEKVNFCLAAGFYYLKNKECVDCTSEQYKIEYTIENSQVTKLGICLDDIKCNTDFPYYSEEEKICKANCDNKKLLLNKDSHDVVNYREGNCLNKCPNEYPYEYTDKNNNNQILCLKQLPENYYYYELSDGTKICIEDCSTISKFIDGDKCVDECKRKDEQNRDYYIYYYIDKDASQKKICIDSCNNNDNNSGFKFSLEAINNHQECIEHCPDAYKYYFEDNYTCYDNCLYGYIDTNSEGMETNKCLSSCLTSNGGQNNHIINGNKCSNKCPEYEEPFSILLDNGVIKCSSSCQNDYYSIDESGEKYLCLKTCSKKKNGKQCLNECPKGMYDELNVCRTNCTKPYFKKVFIDPPETNENTGGLSTAEVTDATEKDYYYLCKDSCENYISSTGECVEKCPLGENYVGVLNKCKSSCSNEDGIFYKDITTSDDKYKIYQCVSNCGSNEYQLEGTKECVSECPYYSSPNGICYKICLKESIYSFSAISVTNDGTNDIEKKICSTGCISNSDYKYFGKDKICVKNCSEPSNIINEQDNACVSKCDQNSEYKYLNEIENSAVPAQKEYRCKTSCVGENKKYSPTDYICVDKCQEPYNFIVNEKICSPKCNEYQFAVLLESLPPEESKEYKCQDRCNTSTIYKYYYKEDKICLDKCNEGDYLIEGTYECVHSCDIINDNDKIYYFYEPEEQEDTSEAVEPNQCVLKCPTGKEYVNLYNHCSKECNEGNYIYSLESEKICMNSCPEGTYNDTFKCLSNCKLSENENYYLDGKTCIDSCEHSKEGNYFFYESDNKCIKKCNDTDFIYKGHQCVPSCSQVSQTDIYIDKNRNCVDKCPNEEKFFIKNFEHSEEDTSKYCLIDCPIDYPFYQIEDNEGKQYYGCYGFCDKYYKSSKDPYAVGKLCDSECEFFVKYNNTHKECFDKCPSDNRYYVSTETKPYQCYEKCPSNLPYHENNIYKCIEKCETGYATFKDRQCISNCEIEDYWIKEKTQDDDEITLCVKDCKDVENTNFYTPEKECVKECDESKFLISNRQKGTCECIGLFYYNENGIKTCFDSNTNKCGDEEKDSKDYKIQIFNSNQCIKNCFGVLSPSEKVCYINGENCPDNSQKGIYEGKVKCECKYKYYYDINKDKICLGENAQCPDEYKYLIPDKNECASSCEGYPLIFDNNCLTTCPTGMSKTEDEKSCKCTKYWYKTSENKYICLKTDEGCNNNYPYLIEETGECVQKCNKTGYEIFYDNQCISSCGNNKIPVDVELGNPIKDIASKTCRCQNVLAEGNCSEDSEKTCKDLGVNDLNYQVKATKECVQKCPDYYKYYFNKECFESCENAKNVFGYDVTGESGSNQCKCIKKWRIKVKESEAEDDLIECLEKCDENEIEIEDSKQCVLKSVSTDNLDDFKCPHTSPYFFNNKCYKECPEGTTIDEIKGNNCKCNSDVFWYKQDSGLIACLSGKCPYNTLPYYINITKECVKSKDQCDDQNYKKIFNYVCYSQCPYLTIDNSDNCECDQKNYFWYKYKNTEDFREYLVCNLEECPPEKPYYINGTNECINRCGDLALYEYSKVCYSECPLFTQKNKNDYICEFSTESNNLQELVGNVTNRIVDIYPDLPNGGLVINNEEASLQIYGLNRDNYNNTDAIIRTNLAYIDLSGCIDKIYESNNMESKDDIVVVKLDLKSRNKKLVINPVEYEFINSNNGKILDASVCEKNQVVISYPITYMLNSQKKRNLQDEEEPELENVEEKEEDPQKKDIMDKFNKGKKLNDQDKSIDTFNFNSSIYYDICTPLEIEGKDLVLENRIQSLFPNYSFCESICTYDYTDFKGERIYCNCSIKSGIDVDRPHGVKIYQFTKNELDDNQKGPTNLPILKCVSKAKIGGNGAFYYCIVFIVIEIILLLLVIFYGISSLMNKIRKKAIDSNGNKDEDKKRIEYNNSENDKISGNKMDRDIKYNINSNSNTKRKMNTNEIKINANPPKNGIVDTDEEEDEKREREININIKKNKENKENKNIVDEKPKFDIFSEPHEMEIENEHNIEIEKYLQQNEIESKKGFFQSMKEEKKLLTAKYNHSLVNDKFDWVTVVLTSIFDKIYIIKILLLSGKYDIIPLMFSLYLLCHMLLLTFVTFFYDVKTIKNIWIKENYPDTNYYLSYGFLANIIVWLIFKMFCCLLDNEHKIRKLNITVIDKKEEKYNRIIYKIKRNMIIYLVLQFLIILFCSFYLITFCGIYVGTKKNVFESYGIAFIEVIIIKIIYGFILGVLRKVSLLKEIKILYNIVLIFNKYIS